MKIKSILLFLTLIGYASSIYGQKLMPYTLGLTTPKDIQTVAIEVERILTKSGFEVLGEYTPAHNKQAKVIAFTSEEIIKAANKIGNLAGFTAAWRIALTVEDGQTVVSYNTPQYWGNAYFRKDFKKVEDLYGKISEKLKEVMKFCGGNELSYFGSEKGLEAKRLQHYRYKVLMPRFASTDVVGKFDNFEEAIETIENNLKTQSDLFTKVYTVRLPGKNVQLYGIGLMGEDGEQKFMPKIDFQKPHHTAFLPYEILVVDNKVHMLAGKYRIAISFPDLSMGTFMKIVSTPGDINDYMEMVCKETKQEN
jgi:uncharacterized protein (DUF302 family)